MRLVIIAGPPSAGKTTVTRQIVRNIGSNTKIAFLKIDVVTAFEDEELKKEFGIDTMKTYSGDLCPDHAEVMVLGDALDWAEKMSSDLLIVESAGLCLRCSPYLNQGLGIVVLDAISGIHAPLKMGPMVSLADIAVVTKIDLVSQAEREVFRQKILEVNPEIQIIETNALQGTSLQLLYRFIHQSREINKENLNLKGVPPLGVCTICVGKKEVGWKHHFGIIKKLDANCSEYLYRGE
ncbi:MAG: GTP-binding protein [Bacillota bacterium]|jgi:Ni2+-binding GTPase involved in maturation of urease and hydrogenase